MDWREWGECVRRAHANDLAQRDTLSKGSFPASGRGACFMRTRAYGGSLGEWRHRLHCSFSISVCFHEAGSFSLEENVLIRIAGDENSCGLFVAGETPEKIGILRPRQGVGFIRH
jgi:hypothetical protein